ncbi:MAG: GNAT family N-acetyltransferase [Candidatus Sericytochromatia bacterium]|nr:GNAT family N-acetyltransferase [Candidatus Tanganyikabacteria bacterium]
MKVQICWDIPGGAWQRLFDASPAASPFHSPAWYAAWHAETGQAVGAVGFKFGDGTRAALPLALERTYRGALLSARSGVAGGYGGLFGPQPLSGRHVRLAFQALARKFPDLAVQAFPHQSWDGAPRCPLTAVTRSQRVRLAPREVLRKGYFKNRRRDSRFAFEFAVDFGPLEGDRLDAFLALYRVATGAWAPDRHVRGEAFWRALGERFTDLALDLAWQQGVVAAARVFAWRGGTAYDLAHVVAPRFRNGEAATAVTEGALVYAHSLGLAYFDMMPSDGQEGVFQFKASFGAQPVPVLEFRQRSLLGRLYDRGRAWLEPRASRSRM